MNKSKKSKKAKKPEKAPIHYVVDLSELPAGYSRLPKFASDRSEANALRMAAHGGRVKAYKLIKRDITADMWPLYVQDDQAKEYIEYYRNRKNPAPVVPEQTAPAEVPAPLAASIPLEEINERFDHIEDKLEKIRMKQEEIITMIYKHMMTNQEVVG